MQECKMNTGSEDQFKETFVDDRSVSAVPPRDTWPGLSTGQLNALKGELEYRSAVYRSNKAVVYQLQEGLRYVEFLLSRPVE